MRTLNLYMRTLNINMRTLNINMRTLHIRVPCIYAYLDIARFVIEILWWNEYAMHTHLIMRKDSVTLIEKKRTLMICKERGNCQ